MRSGPPRSRLGSQRCSRPHLALDPRGGLPDQALVLGTEATEWFNILTASTINGNPHILIPFGSRMVYIVDIFDSAALGKVSTLLVSEVSRPQWVTFDLHSLTLPGGLSIRAALVMNNILYVFGPAWTFAYSDNLQFPASWAQPIQIDVQIGVNAPACVTNWTASLLAPTPIIGLAPMLSQRSTRSVSSTRLTDLISRTR